jgi:lactate permease
VFITGSDTSANALFGKLQSVTAISIGVDPVITVAANVSGGVVGKMISPQSIAVAAAAGNLVGKESELFRFTVKHSFIMLLFICIIVFIQAYVVKWIIPPYELLNQTAASSVPSLTKGYSYLLLLVAVLIAFAISIFMIVRRKNYKTKEVDLLAAK